ncbi:MAG TPA: serine/threonine-protein kinase, partial [Vicinamibacterales bacterium]|nr:serine/threonine-protein kinase [Vicinamibacterales bacterium]
MTGDRYLSSGTRLGPHEIVRLVGAGGMGEVYEARDTRLDRVVAVKVLPSEFGSDPERRARFVREAKTIAQLNHPHICTLYDVGRDADTDYLVMELLEGETLADRLKEGPLPVDDALRYGAEIADALATAHKAGVVHRDLKPGNIMLTKAGAKLLDFGLAKSILAPVAGSSGVTATPTMT